MYPFSNSNIHITKTYDFASHRLLTRFLVLEVYSSCEFGIKSNQKVVGYFLKLVCYYCITRHTEYRARQGSLFVFSLDSLHCIFFF